MSILLDLCKTKIIKKDKKVQDTKDRCKTKTKTIPCIVSWCRGIRRNIYIILSKVLGEYTLMGIPLDSC